MSEHDEETPNPESVASFVKKESEKGGYETTKERAEVAERRNTILLLLLIVVILITVPTMGFLGKNSGEAQSAAAAKAEAAKAGDDFVTQIINKCKQNDAEAKALRTSGYCKSAEEAKQQIDDSTTKPVAGIPGRDGKNGVNGQDGTDGQDGVDGQDGQPGSNGKDGENGENGVDGKNGVDGQSGKDGVPGLPGSEGKSGTDGQNGNDGTDGKTGLGIAGIACSQSAPNDWVVTYTDQSQVLVPGPCKAQDGKTGPTGEAGPTGPTGSAGPTGEQGAPGKDAYPFSFSFVIPAKTPEDEPQTVTCVVSDPQTTSCV